MRAEETAPAHQPVLYHEVLEALRPKPGSHYLDGTVGVGGHARGLLHASSPDGELVGLDVDSQALDLAAQRLSGFGVRVILSPRPFGEVSGDFSAVGVGE